MRLVVDTSVLVGELLRSAGRQRLGEELLDLFIPEATMAETAVELPRRILAFAQARRLDPLHAEVMTVRCLEAVKTNVAVLDEAIYAPLEDEARARSLRDPDDWPAVAAALALSAGIWTNDNDFLGVGIATWTTETLRLWLERPRRTRSHEGGYRCHSSMKTGASPRMIRPGSASTSAIVAGSSKS